MNKGYLSSLFILFLMMLFAAQEAFATHNRAGEIFFAFIGQNTVQATIQTWTRASSIPADRDSLTIVWGDGTSSNVLRTNGPIDQNGYPGGVLLGNDIKYNTYIGIHTYPGAPPPPDNFYIVSMQDPNRNAGIINIGGNQGSVNIPFYIEDTIFYPANIQDIGYDQSPICWNPPIDFANVGDTFLHNPAAYDPNGDSISFRMIVPLQFSGTPVPAYVDPTLVPPGPEPLDKETLDVHTGMYMWAVPQTQGIYNVAFLISEYRRGVLLGTIDRDMQIIVLADSTLHNPIVQQLHDTCVRAGDDLKITVTGRDPDLSQLVTLSGYGGPLAGDPAIFPDSLSPATFTTNANGGNPVTGLFNWNTVCLDIRSQPYEIVFKAQNSFVTPLTDEITWNIDVIAPPPVNLRSSVVHKKVQLNWNYPYLCENIHNFRGFSIWRRVGSNPFIPAYCQTGLAGEGYTMIASGVYDSTYLDQTAVGGQQLCYRILANFYQESPNGLYDYDNNVSVASNETCIYLPYDVPVITNASVLQTDKAAGQMFVAWTKPRTGGTNLDTVISPPPYRFDLYRGTGFNPAASTLINTVTRTSFASLIDTVFTDTNLNTTDSPYCYQVLFYSDGDTVGSTAKASSVYVSAYPSDSKMRLTWNYNVPWLQDSFQIWRQNFASGAFNYITTVPTTAYVDTGLLNDSTYCYYINAFSHYTSSFIYAPLSDSSQILCAVPVDTIPPCPPVVSISNDCTNPPSDTAFYFVNYLSWQNFTDSCGYTTVKYRIYYTPDSGGAMTLIDSVIGIANTTYSHILNSNSLAGCYIVTAVDKRGNESYKINQVCISDCPNYNLPNTFTPNGDGHNDYFTPYHPYRFITRIDMKIFNRWGEKVFETTNPEIMWDGKDQKSGKDCSDGVYLYAGYYYEQTLHGEIQKRLPQKNGGGFIHLIRDK